MKKLFKIFAVAMAFGFAAVMMGCQNVNDPTSTDTDPTTNPTTSLETIDESATYTVNMCGETYTDLTGAEILVQFNQFSFVNGVDYTVSGSTVTTTFAGNIKLYKDQTGLAVLVFYDNTFLTGYESVASATAVATGAGLVEGTDYSWYASDVIVLTASGYAKINGN